MLSLQAQRVAGQYLQLPLLEGSDPKLVHKEQPRGEGGAERKA